MQDIARGVSWNNYETNELRNQYMLTTAPDDSMFYKFDK